MLARRRIRLRQHRKDLPCRLRVRRELVADLAWRALARVRVHQMVRPRGHGEQRAVHLSVLAQSELPLLPRALILSLEPHEASF